jgi:hypothetical protein
MDTIESKLVFLAKIERKIALAIDRQQIGIEILVFLFSKQLAVDLG